MRIGIVGHGVVGKHLEESFRFANLETVVYDKYDPSMASATRKAEVNDCDAVFIAVPTPQKDGGECDTSIVEETVAWIQRPICIKSTVVPGTTQRLVALTGKDIVFSPEYVGETCFHRYRDFRIPDLIAVGGKRRVCEIFIDAYRSAFGPEPTYIVTDSNTAELAKYMENCFLATKVAFVSQFYLLAQQLEADFTQMREIWVADTRVGKSHSTVVDGLGFGGRCLPKDLSAIIRCAQQHGTAPTLLEAVQNFNNSLKEDQSDGLESV